MAMLLLLTLLSLSTTILSLAENINIDCGASESYSDSSNVLWVGDKDFTTTGEPFKITHNVERPVDTLRFFPSGSTNCYNNIPATRHRTTLVRTMFYYGNYDMKSSPPSFDVIYDWKHRHNVVSNFSLTKDLIFISEVIFSPEKDKISVCLIRTSPLYVPFISSIEVYGMDAGMYDDLGPDEGLMRPNIILPHHLKELKRDPDPYGRFWFLLIANKPRKLSTSASSIDITGASNKPPKSLLSKALSADDLRLSVYNLPSYGSPIYLALYFSEPQSLGQTKKRSFNVFLDEKQLNSDPIVPVFGKATEFVVRDIVATSRSKVIFQSTSDSDLPPIVNAMELYSISNGKDGGFVIPGGVGGGGQSGEGNDDDRDKGRKKSQPKPQGKPKLPVILGASLGSALAAVSSVFAAISLKRRNQKAKSQSNTEPAMSTGSEAKAGVEPLVGQQLASDVSHPGNDKPGV